MAERLTEKTDEGIWVKESPGDNALKTLYRCYGAEPLPDYSNCDEGYLAIKKLADYETAEEEGRLVVIPCKEGDTVWTFYDDMSGAFGFTVEEVQIVFDGRSKPYFLIDNMDFEIDCIGKTLFFTHEEAEKALTKMNGGQPSAQ